MKLLLIILTSLFTLPVFAGHGGYHPLGEELYEKKQVLIELLESTLHEADDGSELILYADGLDKLYEQGLTGTVDAIVLEGLGVKNSQEAIEHIDNSNDLGVTFGLKVYSSSCKKCLFCC